MELATLRTLYFANLYRERALRCRVAEIVRAIEPADEGQGQARRWSGRDPDAS